jgi:4-amino-4-deoxy-L-arabinose transferase-like glycosyltransferase
MPPPAPSFLQWLLDWRRFCALLLLLFLARAVFVLSVLPPFEGWDEYQHVAHIAYIAENGRSPVLMGENNVVPRSLYPGMVSLPHSRLGAEQMVHAGAKDYSTFWEGERPTVRADAGPVALYQAQQAPLYYWLMSPPWQLMRGSENLLAAVTVLRLINVCLGAAAVLVSLSVVGRIIRPGPARYVIGLLIAVQPLFLLNAARVANDALAIFLGTLVVSLLLVSLQKHFWLSAIGSGIALGLAVLAKATALTLIPFILFVLASEAWRGRLTYRKAAAGLTVSLGLTLLVTFWYFQANFARYGVLTPLQESVLNHKAGKTVADAIHAAWQIEWWKDLRPRCFEYNLWFGGWTWLEPPKLTRRPYAACLYLAALGLCLGFRKQSRRDRLLFADGITLMQVIAICAAAFAGLAYHSIHTQMAWGTVAANSWYASAAFPWLICLYYQGAAFFGSRWAPRLLASIMLGAYLLTEALGTLTRMVPAYTGHSWGPIARERLAQMHLPGMGPVLTLPALCTVFLLAAIAATTAIAAGRLTATLGQVSKVNPLSADR